MEQIFHWMAAQLDLSFLYRRYVHLYVNGVRRDQGSAVYSDTQEPGSDYLKQWYPADKNGDLYKIELWWQSYVFPLTTGVVYVNPTLTLQLRSGALDIPRYRWNWLKRSVQAGLASDYTSISNLLMTLTNANAPSYLTNVQSQVDVEQWMRVVALRRIACEWDGYGAGNLHNAYAFKPATNRWRLHATDVDTAFVVSGVSPNKPMTTGWSIEPKIADMINTPAFRRDFYRAVQDAVNGPMRPATHLPSLTANYAALTDNGIAPSNSFLIVTNNMVGTNTVFYSNYFTPASWLSNRWNSLTNELAKVTQTFAITNHAGANYAVTNATNITLSGKAPMEVVYIRVNGAATNANVTWTSVTNWSLGVTLAFPPSTNTTTVQGYDRLNQLLATNLYQKSITITNK